MMYDPGDLPNVGPTADSGSCDLTQQVHGMMNGQEHAPIHIAQPPDRIEKVEARLARAD